MSDFDPKSNPAFLLEASRVFNAASRVPQDSNDRLAQIASNLALTASARAVGTGLDAKVRAAILCDAAALRLSGRVRGGWSEALSLLEKVPEASSEDGGGRVWILRAFAYGQELRDLARGHRVPIAEVPEAERQPVVDRLLEALGHVSPALLKMNRHFWNSEARGPLPQGSEGEDDLQAAYTLPQVRAAIDARVGPGGAGATSPP